MKTIEVLLFELDFNEYYLLSQEKLLSLGFDKYLQQSKIKETGSQKLINRQPQPQLQKLLISQFSQKNVSKVRILEKQKNRKNNNQNNQIIFIKRNSSRVIKTNIQISFVISIPQQPILAMSPINIQYITSSASSSNIFQPQTLQNFQSQFEQQILQQQQINQKLQQLQQQQKQEQMQLQLQSQAKPQLPKKFITSKSQLYQIQQQYQPNFNNSVPLSQNQSQSQIRILQPNRNEFLLSQDENQQQLMVKQFNIDNSSDEVLI